MVAVPLSAVFTEHDPDTYDTRRFVYVKNGTEFEKRFVELGVSDFFHAEIQSGLKPGETVALEPPPGGIEQVAQQNSRSGKASSGGAATAAAGKSSGNTNAPASNGGKVAVPSAKAASPTT